jgi:hypothetical protein
MKWYWYTAMKDSLHIYPCYWDVFPGECCFKLLRPHAGKQNRRLLAGTVHKLVPKVLRKGFDSIHNLVAVAGEEH